MAYPAFTEEALAAMFQQDNSHISTGGNGGTYSLPRDLEVVILPLN
jgi:hypothetical protein